MAAWTVPAVVERIVDADTLLCRCDLGWRIQLTCYVRLLGINAPEQATDDGRAATAFVADLVPPGTAVQVVSRRLLGQTDSYGRVLAAVTLPDGRDLSITVLDAGHATVYPQKN